MVHVLFFLVAMAFISNYICNGFIYSLEPRIVLSRARCGPREYYNECGSRCTPACKRHTSDCNECVEGCYCRKPFQRSVFGGPCVRVCPQRVRPKKPTKKPRSGRFSIPSE